VPLFVEFQIGDNGYLLDTADVAQVLPLLDITRVPHAPIGVAGICNYHGAPVPVIDLGELVAGEPAKRHFSTRLILVRYPDHAGQKQLLGLIAEKVTQTVTHAVTEFNPPGIASNAAPYLVSVCAVGRRLLQRIEVSKLLPAEVSEVLFRPQPEEDSWPLPESKRC
jgi:chemotaxis-related protein WspB